MMKIKTLGIPGFNATAIAVSFVSGAFMGCNLPEPAPARVSDYTNLPPERRLNELNADDQIDLCLELDVERFTFISFCPHMAALRTLNEGGDREHCRALQRDCQNRETNALRDRCAALFDEAWGSCEATVQDVYDCNSARGESIPSVRFSCDRLDQITEDAVAAWNQSLSAADAEPACAPLSAACGAPAPAADSFAFPTAAPRRSWSRVVIEGPARPTGDFGFCQATSDCGQLISVTAGCTAENCNPEWMFDAGCGTPEEPTFLPTDPQAPIVLGFDDGIEGCVFELFEFGGPIEGYQVELCDALSEDCVPVEPGEHADGTTRFRLPSPEDPPSN
jgi:hypothetical protein